MLHCDHFGHLHWLFGLLLLFLLLLWILCLILSLLLFVLLLSCGKSGFTGLFLRWFDEGIWYLLHWFLAYGYWTSSYLFFQLVNRFDIRVDREVFNSLLIVHILDILPIGLTSNLNLIPLVNPTQIINLIPLTSKLKDPKPREKANKRRTNLNESSTDVQEHQSKRIISEDGHPVYLRAGGQHGEGFD